MSYPVCAGPITPRSGRLLRRANFRAILACTIAALAGAPVMAQTLTWDVDPSTEGNQPGTGDWGGPLAWLNGAANQAWVNGADAIIPTSGASSFAIDVGSVTLDDLTASGGYTLQNGTLTFAGGEGSHVIRGGVGVSISAVVAGSEGITIVGGVTLSGANTYSGVTTLGAVGIGGGILTVTGGNAIPDGSTISAIGGSQFVVKQSETIGNLSGIARVSIETGAILTIGANGANTTFEGKIFGEGGLTKVGAGRAGITTSWDFWTESPYSGDIVVNEGELVFHTPGLGIDPTSKVSVAAGATMVLPSQSTIGGLTGAGTFKFGNSSLTLNGATGEFSGEIGQYDGAAEARVIIGSSSNVTFSGPNSFKGSLDIYGTLSVPTVADAGINNPIGSGAGVLLRLNDGAKFALTGPGNHLTNRQFWIQDLATSTVEVVGGATLELSSSLGGTGTLKKTGSGTLRLVVPLGHSPNIWVDEGILAIEAGLTSIRSLRGSGTVDLAGGVLRIYGAPNGGGHSGTIQGPAALQIDGTSILQGANTFYGGLYITPTGTLTVSDFNLPGTPGPLGVGPLTVKGSLYHSASADVTSNREFTVYPTSAGFGMTGPHTLTLGGLISGSGGVPAVGSQSTLQLTNPANSFTGPITVNNSALRIENIPMSGVNSPIGAGDKITINNGRLVFTQAGVFTSDRSLELSGEATLSVAAGDTSLHFPVTGAGSLNKVGAGRWVQTDSTYDFTGRISIQEGIVQTGVLANAGIASALGRGSVISLGGSSAYGELHLLPAVDSSTNRTIDVQDGGGRIQAASSTIALNGSFTGNGALTFAGNGADTTTFVISGQGHQGAVIIDSARIRSVGFGHTRGVHLAHDKGGVLQIDGPTQVGSLHGGGGSNLGRAILNAPLTVGGDHTNSTFDGVIEGAATLTKIGQGILTLTSANTFTGGLVVSGGTVAFTGTPGNGMSPLGSVQLASGTLRFTGAGVISMSQTLSVGSGTIDIPEDHSTLVWAGSVNGGLGLLNKEGAGTLRLSGANAFLGSTNINAGKLQVIGSNALPNEGTVTVASGAALELLPGTNETIGALQGTGSLVLGGQRLTLGGTNASTFFAGTISGGGASQLEKTGSGTLTLSNLNSSFTGGVIISDGAVSVPSLANVGVNSPLGSNGPIILGDSSHTGRLIVTDMTQGGTDRPIVLMSGGAAVEVAHPEAEFELGGSISGPGSLLKLGAGKLELSSPLGGPLVVAAGTLILNTDISGTGGAATIIAPGYLETPAGVSHGVGQLNLLSGTIAPGGTEAIGMLTAEGITFDSGTFDLDLQGTSPTQYDSLHVNGIATFNGPVELSIGLGFDPADWTDSFHIVINDGNEAVTLNGANGRFSYRGNLLEDGEHFLVNDGGISQFFYVEYGVAGDNDIELFAAPEPGAASLLLTAGMCLFARRRRTAGGATR